MNARNQLAGLSNGRPLRREAVRPCLAVTIAALLVSASPARAGEPTVDAAVQLSLTGTLLEYRSMTVSTDAATSTTTASTLSLLSTGAGLGVAYGLGSSWLLGGRVRFTTSTSQTGDHPGATTTAASFMPSLEYAAFSVSLAVAISGWLGRAQPRPEARASATSVPPAGGGEPSVVAGQPPSNRDGPAPASRPGTDSEPKLTENRGKLFLSFGMGDGSRAIRVVISGEPARDPLQVQLTAIPATPAERDARCVDLALEFSGTRAPVGEPRSGQAEDEFSRKSVYVQGALAESVLQALGQTHAPARFVACGESWTLDKSIVERIYEFDGSFRSRARFRRPSQ